MRAAKSGRRVQTQEERYEFMTATPVPELIVTLAVPTIISMLVTSFYNMADTFFVGRISTQATAAVGVVFSVMAMIQALGFFCGHGSGNYMSRRMGAGDLKGASEMAATGFVLAFALGLAVMAAGLVFLEPLSVLLGATPTILTETKDYLRVILLGAPFMCAQLVLNNQLRFEGSAVYAMAGLVSGALINIILDPVLIFGLGLGVSGAAAATTLSQMISFGILYYGSCQGPNIRIRLSSCRLNRHYLLEIINGGMPSLARQGLASISVVVLNTAAGTLGGDAAIAGMSVVNRVMMFANSALIGFGQGFQPVAAFNWGAAEKKRVREGFWFCVRYGTVFLIAAAVFCFAFSRQIITLFRSDEDVVRIGSFALRCQAAVFPVNAFIVMSNMMLQSIGMGVRATSLASLRSGVFLMAFLMILTRLFGLLGVETAQTAADVATFFAALALTLPVLSAIRHED